MCISHWKEDYTQPEKTEHHSPLSQLLENAGQLLKVVYEQQEGVKPYARSVLIFSKGEIR
jgi:hypothetical protein